jgi:hypothetical protein
VRDHGGDRDQPHLVTGKRRGDLVHKGMISVQRARGEGERGLA